MSHSPPTRLISPAESTRRLSRLRRQVWLGLVREQFQQSRLRVGLIAVLTLLFWSGLCVLFYEGFYLLRTAIVDEPTRTQMVHAIFNFFFATLLVMLAISEAILFFAAAFRADDSRLLSSLPADDGAIALHKFWDSALLACWGFFVLGSPLVVAYGVANGSPWYYFVAALPLIAFFALTAASLGALLCLIVVRWAPAIRGRALALILVLLAAAMAALLVGVFGGPSHTMLSAEWFRATMGKLQIAEVQLLPSWWLSTGLLEAAHPASEAGGRQSWIQCLWLLTLLASSGLLGVIVLVHLGRRWLAAAANRVAGSSRIRKVGRAWTDRVLAWLARPLPRPMALMLLKDARIFRRDPMQWSQFAIFFGLLGLYFVNIQRFQYGALLVGRMSVIGWLNLAVVGLILSTFTTRFIFPSLSVEGSRFWILGAMPVERATIMRSKLFFAWGLCGLPCAVLILLSDVALGVVAQWPELAALRQVACLSLCAVLCSLAVGLGARLPDFRQTSPAKVAAGFGGTLNLVLSMGLIVLVVGVAAVPGYCYALARSGAAGAIARRGIPSWLASPWALVGAGTIIVIACSAISFAVLRVGRRRFERLEV